jgi:glycosyltransferase involved in cell wall biosynthesis
VIRVGYDTTAAVLNRAGEARYTLDLLGELRRRDDVDMRVLSPTARVPRSVAQRIALQAWVQGAHQPLALARQAAALDVLHLTRPLVAPLRGLRTPTVVTVHDVLALRAPQYFSPVIRTNFQLLGPRTIRRAAAVLTGSEYSRREIVELVGAGPDRVHVVPLGLEPRFRPRPADPARLAARFGIDRPYVLCVGTLEVRKNLLGALEAFSALRDLDVQLVVAGGVGWMNDEFARVVRDVRDHVIVTGYIGDDDLVGLMSSAACFLYPSFLEGFGFPPLEAMACGAPVVSSTGGSLPEVCGDAALLVDPADTRAITGALERVLTDEPLAADLRRRGLERSRAFTWARCAEGTVDVYRAAANSAGA